MFWAWWWDAVQKADAEKPDAESVQTSEENPDDEEEKPDGD